MAKPYTINIVNGTGQASVVNDSYTVSSSVVGYNNTSINPSSITIDGTTTTQNFTIAADGTLTLHVTEDGTVSGTPVVGATFNRTDAEGNIYGNVITTDSNGDAVFNNVPYAETDTPIIYYKQISSDGDHNFDNTVKNTTLTTSTETLQIENALPALQTFNLTDANYEGLKIDTGTITLS
jgi:hypothetical protein